jgi:hypothetical protein
MVLYKKKIIPYGFIVICPTPNIGQIKMTLNSLNGNYAHRPVVTVVPKDVIETDLGDLAKIGLVVKGEDSLTSQINIGMAKTKCKEWNFIIQAGTWVQGLLDMKFSQFIESEKDILFPILNKKITFTEASWNGTLIHKETIKKLGPFPDNNPEDVCKLLWTIEAIELGYKFKAIVGSCHLN